MYYQYRQYDVTEIDISWDYRRSGSLLYRLRYQS